MSRIAILLLALAVHTTALDGQTPERPRVFLLVIDDLHLDFRQTPRTRALIQETVDTLAGNGALWSVVSTGTSSLAVGPTADLSTVRAAIRRMIGNGLKAEEFAGPAAAERQRRADAADQATAAAIADVAATLDRERSLFST